MLCESVRHQTLETFSTFHALTVGLTTSNRTEDSLGISQRYDESAVESSRYWEGVKMQPNKKKTIFDRKISSQFGITAFPLHHNPSANLY